MTKTGLSTEEQVLIDAVSTKKLMDSTTTIAQWVRLSGTADEAKAFDWIERQLQHYGMQTKRYAHPALVSWPESASLTITSSGGDSQLINCATHAFTAPTSPGGLESELVYVGRGTEEELRKADVGGKVVLVDGIATSSRNMVVERAGVVGSIWIAGTHLHERSLSPVWGTPTPKTAHLLPKTPSVSVSGGDGARIKAALEKGPVRVKMQTRVFRGWKQIPCLIGDLQPAAQGPESETFVMLSGHIDSWYYGAMDNASGNATQLEVSRILAQRRSWLRRGLRVAFWSGHSHGRFAGSAWYADNFWQDLHDHCVANITVDSVGGKGATVLSQANSMAELRSFGSDVIEQIAGQRLAPRRYGRSGDQSFWGHGIPSLLMTLSEQPPEAADPVLLALHREISGGERASGGFGWWWHTPEDTVDKIGPEFLRRDAIIYALLIYRLCTVAILPLDYSAVVAELKANLAEIQSKCRDHFDFSPINSQLAALELAIERLQSYIAEMHQAGGVDDKVALQINRCLMKLGRELIPVDYTCSGLFDHDLAIPIEPLPGLQPAAKLASMQVESDEYQFLHTQLVWERNRVTHALTEAGRVVEDTFSTLDRYHYRNSLNA